MLYYNIYVIEFQETPEINGLNHLMYLDSSLTQINEPLYFRNR